MDETDIRMAIQLGSNPRITFRELSATLGLSVNAVHKRFRSLCEQGTFCRFAASPSPSAYDVPVCLVIGRYDGIDEDRVMESLAADERIHSVYVGSGEFLYVAAVPRPGEDMGELRDWIVDSCKLVDHSFDYVTGPVPTKGLDKDDHCIIAALQEDCRRPLQEVADLTGLSMKSVKRRLKRMQDEHLIWMRLVWSPLSSGDYLGFFHVTLKDPTKAHEAINIMMRDFMPPVIGVGAFPNNPSNIIINAWARNLVDLHETRMRIQSTGLFSTMRYQVLTDMEECSCWLDKVSKQECSKRCKDGFDAL